MLTFLGCSGHICKDSESRNVGIKYQGIDKDFPSSNRLSDSETPNHQIEHKVSDHKCVNFIARLRRFFFHFSLKAVHVSCHRASSSSIINSHEVDEPDEVFKLS